jgi:hypothetical protein
VKIIEAIVIASTAVVIVALSVLLVSLLLSGAAKVWPF